MFYLHGVAFVCISLHEEPVGSSSNAGSREIVNGFKVARVDGGRLQAEGVGSGVRSVAQARSPDGGDRGSSQRRQHAFGVGGGVCAEKPIPFPPSQHII